jgi:glutathione S-transferase
MLTLHYHPFSSYCQKVLVALYENGTDFTPHLVDLGDPEARAALRALWPICRFPVLVDGDRTVPESSCIIEHLALRHPGPIELIPTDPEAALEVRLEDRFYDAYVHTPMQKIVGDALRPDGARDPHGVAEAEALLDLAYDMIEARMADRTWACGDAFTLADCAAAPALFYGDWARPIGADRPRVAAYRERLCARPSFARAIDEARPWRKHFPLGARD